MLPLTLIHTPTHTSTHPLKDSQKSGGFTLIEVLVSLVLLALSFGAVMSAVGNQSFQLLNLRDRFHANRVAMHIVGNFYVQSTWPSLGEEIYTIDIDEQEWRWKSRVLATSEPKLRRVEIYVYANPEVKITNTQAYDAKQVFFVSNPTLAN